MRHPGPHRPATAGLSAASASFAIVVARAAFVSLVSLLPAGCDQSTHPLTPFSANVQDLRVTASQGKVTLSWTDPVDPKFERVEIWYGTNGAASTRYHGCIDCGGTEITGLVDGEEYTIVVVAIDDEGRQSEGTVGAGLPVNPPPAAVSGLQATAANHRVTLTWTDPTDSDFAGIVVTCDPGALETLVDAAEGTVTITSLTNDTTYTFSVVAVDTAGGESEATTVESIPVESITDIEVTGLTATAGYQQVTLDWTNPTDEDFDHCEVTWSPGGSTPVEVAGTASSKVVTGLTSGTEYTFTVKTLDPLGNHSAGTSASATPPVPVVATDDTGTVPEGCTEALAIASLIANDTNNLTGDPLEIVEVKDAVNGTAEISGTNVEFTSTGSAGVDASFVYVVRIQGQTLHQDEGTVTLTVEPSDVVANTDAAEVQQGEAVLISVSSLLANDEGEGLTFVDYGSPVGGSVSKSDQTITFTSTGLAYEAASFQYTVRNGDGATDSGTVNVSVTPLPTIEAYICADSAAVQSMLTSYTPPTVQDIFDSWGRFDGNSFYENKDAEGISANALAWELLTDPDRVSMPLNVWPYNGFVSSEELESYALEVTLSSTNADDDTIGVVIAFVRQDDTNYTLCAVRNNGGNPPSNRFEIQTGAETEKTGGWGVLYGEGATYNTWTIESGTVGGWSHSGEGGWGGQETRVRVVRQGDTIRCHATDWDDTGSYDAESEIVVDLTSDARLDKFRGAKPYGYMTLSQPDSTYLDIVLDGGLDATSVYDASTGEVWTYSVGTGWTKSTGVSIQDRVGYVRFVTNPDTGDTFLVTETEVILQDP